MKYFKHIIALLFLFSFALPSHSQSIDYSSYEIARKYKTDNNLILAYKYLLIFKYSNLPRLNEATNSEVLKKINKLITDMENLLSENISWYSVKRSRGFSDKQLDSTLKARKSNINFDPIAIK